MSRRLSSYEEELLDETVVRDDLPPAVDEFCHIQSGDEKTFYCGRRDLNPAEVTCALYKGEAICPSCGRPTCPQCAVMSSLNERLEPE